MGLGNFPARRAHRPRQAALRSRQRGHLRVGVVREQETGRHGGGYERLDGGPQCDQQGRGDPAQAGCRRFTDRHRNRAVNGNAAVHRAPHHRRACRLAGPSQTRRRPVRARSGHRQPRASRQYSTDLAGSGDPDNRGSRLGDASRRTIRLPEGSPRLVRRAGPRASAARDLHCSRDTARACNCRRTSRRPSNL
jgi:hypothetical protein